MKKMTRAIFFGSMLVAFAVFSGNVFAAIKDSDHDGLSESGEVTIYKTDPNVFDTDGDGVGDGDEVILKTNPLDAADVPVSELASARTGVLDAGSPFSWYFARATGIVSFFLLTIVVVHGLIMSSRAFVRTYPASIALETHRFLSWAAMATVTLHFGSFLFDKFLPMTISETLIPFLFPTGTKSMLGFDLQWTVALGIIAVYLMALLTVSSEFRTKIPLKVWRVIHYSSFAAYPLFLAHGILSGTDSKQGWMMAMYGVSAIAVFGLIVVRLIFRNRAVRLVQKMRSEQS